MLSVRREHLVAWCAGMLALACGSDGGGGATSTDGPGGANAGGQASARATGGGTTGTREGGAGGRATDGGRTTAGGRPTDGGRAGGPLGSVAGGAAGTPTSGTIAGSIDDQPGGAPGQPGSAGAMAGRSGASNEVGGSAGAGGRGLADCSIPDAQLLDPIHPGAVLTFTAPGSTIEVGTASSVSASEPDAWQRRSTLTLPSDGSLKVFARVVDADCAPRQFEHVYTIAESYPGPVGDPTSTAIALDDASIVGWATGYENLVFGANSTNATYQDPALLLGTAVESSFDVVALGDGGQVTLTFDPPITNGPGADFAVFENGSSDVFLELAFVEVSSDGESFVGFDTAYLGATPVDGFGSHSTTLFGGLAGKYRQGYGQPYDLDLLRYRSAVQAGAVDLDRITHVRIVDVIGDGSVADSFGNVVYDPYPTQQTAGFDLDAIAILNAAD